MLKKIEAQEIMTRRAAKEKYRTQYILMIITEFVDRLDNDLGYVIYTADKERDFSSISTDEYKDKTIAYLTGGAAEPYPAIGNVVYHG